jgi:hypothetical protein
MTHTTPAPRDRAADFSDAVVASYIHEISTRNRPARRSSHPRRFANPRPRADAASTKRLLQQ